MRNHEYTWIMIIVSMHINKQEKQQQKIDKFRNIKNGNSIYLKDNSVQLFGITFYVLISNYL